MMKPASTMNPVSAASGALHPQVTTAPAGFKAAPEGKSRG